MTQAFLSYQRDSASTVQVAANILGKILIKPWLDTADLKGQVARDILVALNQSRYFIPFMNEAFLRSEFCQGEVSRAVGKQFNQHGTIIPVALEPIDQLKRKAVAMTQDGMLMLDLLSNNTVLWDAGDEQASALRLAREIQKHEAVAFGPIEQLHIEPEIDGRTQSLYIQHIPFTIAGGDLASSWLADPGLDIQAFRRSVGGQEPVLDPEAPIAFSGQGPNWLYGYLTIPLKNLNPVMMYNTRNGQLICLQESGRYPGLKGRTWQLPKRSPR